MGSYDVKMVIVIRKDLGMRKGKMCAQAGHASMQFMMSPYVGGRVPRCDYDDTERTWFAGGMAKIVVGTENEHELHEVMREARKAGLTVHQVIDSGATEFDGEPTLTCCAIGPDRSDAIDPVTGHLKLL